MCMALAKCSHSFVMKITAAYLIGGRCVHYILTAVAFWTNKNSHTRTIQQLLSHIAFAYKYIRLYRLTIFRMFYPFYFAQTILFGSPGKLHSFSTHSAWFIHVPRDRIPGESKAAYEK